MLGPTDDFIPHWPQPGLIPRDPARGRRIETLCFKGSETNLYEPFRSPAFREELQSCGLELQYDVKENAGPADPPRWHDYSSTDLVLAVRDATEVDLKIKPASKLVNAWLAGCPALLGPEPAFQALRRGELDYFEVREPKDVLAVVAKLRDSPSLFEAIVRNGTARAAEFSHQRVTECWHRLLSGPAARDFSALRSKRGSVHRARRWVRFCRQVLLHKANVRKYLKNRDHGFRPISQRWT